MNRLAFVLALALVSVSPSLANAWTPLSGSRPVWDGTVAYSLNQNGSDDLPFATVEAEVRRGMEDWTELACTSLSTRYDGVTSTPPSSGDNQFVIGWVESGWAFAPSAIGVALTRFTPGRIVEADIQMNGVNFTWTAGPGSGSQVNLYSIALHEGGHAMGLGHSSVSGAAMYFAYPGGIISIHADDQEGMCTLYPGEGGEAMDCNSTGCPAGQVCVSGACQPEGGPGPGPGPGGELCADCSVSADCGGGGDYCLGYPGGSSHCGRACAVDGDCGSGGRCVTVSNGARQCVRFVDGAPNCAAMPPDPGACSADTDCAAAERCEAGSCIPAPTDCAELGEACEAHTDCLSWACLTGVCTQSCGWPSGACPDGFYCDGFATGACGPGVCLAGGPGPRANGEACGSDAECASRTCHAGTCAAPCVPSIVGACADGAVCQVGALSCRGACGTTGTLGDPCEGNSDCATSLCANHQGSGFCTDVCDASAPCPSGFRCESGGLLPVCVPEGGVIGDDCGDNADCASGLCAVEVDRNYCTRLCDGSSPCPSGLACVESGTQGLMVCQPGAGGQPRRLIGGCRAAPARSPSGPFAFVFAVLVIAIHGRRRTNSSRRPC